MRASRAFTVIELLVVVLIIAILAGLTIPAVQLARASSRATQCRNQMRNLAVAVASFEAANRRYPGYQEEIAQGNVNPGVSSNKCATWLVLMLPFMERDDLYLGWSNPRVPITSDLTPFLSFYYCPSEETPDLSRAENSYVANAGFYATEFVSESTTVAYRSAQRPANGVFHDRYAANWEHWAADNGLASYGGLPIFRAADLRDGASHTLLLSENMQPRGWYKAGPTVVDDDLPGGIWREDTDFFTRGGRLHTTFMWAYFVEEGAACNNPLGPAPLVWEILQINGLRVPGVVGPRPSSWHSGGVNVAYADGSVGFLSESIAYHVYQHLMTPHGAKSDMPDLQSVLSDFWGK